MKKAGLAIIIMAIFISPTFGKTVPIEVAKKVGYHFLLQQGNTLLAGAEDLQLSYTGASPASLYAFSGKHCFVIVAADDAVNPILGYATDRPFGGNTPPPVVERFLRNYAQQIGFASANNIAATPAIAGAWEGLINNTKPVAAKTTAGTIGPLLHTTWGQDAGYNDFCPYDAAACSWCGNHVFTGCVATAMAQIMKYWNWPGHGSGANSYTPPGYSTQSINFNATYYDWGAMPDNGPSNAIATLMYNAGVSVNMQYGIGGSGARSEGGPPSAEHALKSYFCYQSSLHSIFRHDYSDASWLSTIMNELCQYRVVMYSGQGSIGGHTWVVDGYDASGYLHCNWGWDGQSNGYYFMNNMVPAPIANGDYNIDQSAVIGIHPDAPDVGIGNMANVCVGYQAGLSCYPAGGAWSSSNPSVATVNSSGLVTGIAEGTTTIKYAMAAGCGSRFATRDISVINGMKKEIMSLASSGVNRPTAVVVDGSGNVYFSERDNHKVKKMTPSGSVSTIAGTGISGLYGDGGPAVSAELNAPIGLALDASGNLYIADAGNNCIRKVTAAGTITTIAGTSTWGYSGDGGIATSAKFDGPEDVAVDASGNVYIADYNNLRIRKINAAGIVTSIAGNGAGGVTGDGGPALSAAIGRPTTVAVDAAGNIYLSGSDCFRIRKVTAGGTITTVAGFGSIGYSGDGGPATNADVQFPSGITIDAAGNLYFADKGNNVVRKVNTLGTISAFAGDGTGGFSGDGGDPTDAQLDQPYDVTFDGSGNMYVTDNNNNRIRKIRESPIDCSLLATRDLPSSATFSIYPNPNVGSFTIVLPEKASSVAVHITDLSGRTINTKPFPNGNDKKISIDLGNIAPGFYLVIVNNGDNVYRDKVLIQ